MMYPIMVKIDFTEIMKAGTAIRPVGLTLIINWAIKPFTMYAIASFFLGTVFIGFIGPEAVDHVKLPMGAELVVGDTYGSGKVVLLEGVKVLQVPLWRSYLAGCILLGIAPCTAMVLVWSFLAKGNDGHTLVMVAIGYGLSKAFGQSYENAAPTAMIGASNHFEVAIATAAMLYGLSSGVALATVVGVLIEVPLMLALVKFCVRPQGWFPHEQGTGEASV